MAHQALAGGLIVSADLVLLHMGQDELQNRLVLFRAQQTVRIGNDGVGPPRIKPGDGLAVLAGSHRVLGLVAVVPQFVHSNDGLHLLPHQCFREASDANQIAPDLMLLEFQLLLIGQGLKLTAAALSVVKALRFCTIP